MRNQVVRWLGLLLLAAPLYANDVYSVYYVPRVAWTEPSTTTVTSPITTTVSTPVVNTTSPYSGFSNTGTTTQYAGSYTTVSYTQSSPSVYTAVVQRFGSSTTESYVPQYTTTTQVNTTPTATTNWTGSYSYTQPYTTGSGFVAVMVARPGMSGMTYSYQSPYQQQPSAIPTNSPLNLQPEPGTYAMLAGGLGLLGIMARRRKK